MYILSTANDFFTFVNMCVGQLKEGPYFCMKYGSSHLGCLIYLYKTCVC